MAISGRAPAPRMQGSVLRPPRQHHANRLAAALTDKATPRRLLSFSQSQPLAPGPLSGP